jgi:NifU-like protein involved in Fe-S cluster formation
MSEDELYKDEIKRLAASATGAGSLDDPKTRVTKDNPLCGDRVSLDVRMAADGRIGAVAHRVKGCLMCRAAAALIGRRAPGSTQGEALRAGAALAALLQQGAPVPADTWPELALFAPLAPHKSRHDCALLPFQALAEGVGCAKY